MVNELKNRLENERPICPVCNGPMPYAPGGSVVEATSEVSVTAHGWAMHAACAGATREPAHQLGARG